LFFFFQAEDGIRGKLVTGVQTCALPIFATLDVAYHASVVASTSADITGLKDRVKKAGDAIADTKKKLDEKRAALKSASDAKAARSEERRVGKECKSRWVREPLKKKDKDR